MPAGCAAGALAALIGATCWALVAVATGMQLAWAAVVTGFMVGYAMRFAGRGTEAIFGVAAGLLAILGCLLGNLLVVIYFAAHASEISYMQSLLTLDLAKTATLVKTSFKHIDFIFYAICVYLAFTIAYGNEQTLAKSRTQART